MILDEELSADITYDPKTGALDFSVRDEVSLSGTLKAAYRNDQTGVVISGSMSTSLFYDPSDMNVILQMDGSKALTP